MIDLVAFGFGSGGGALEEWAVDEAGEVEADMLAMTVASVLQTLLIIQVQSERGFYFG